jgi:protein-S-isoprenylcysteine O-methyltransferase Ste14
MSDTICRRTGAIEEIRENGAGRMRDMKIMVGGVLITICAIGQIILAIVFYDPEGSELRINIGWLILMLSGLLGWLPILAFRRFGRVEGHGYMRTSALVDRGVLGIVRHPQYLAGVLISIALPLITWHWLVVVLGLLAAPIYYWNTYDEEERCIEKFGDDYRDYMKRVPRMNFVLGFWRMIRRRMEGETTG